MIKWDQILVSAYIRENWDLTPVFPFLLNDNALSRNASMATRYSSLLT